MFEKNNPKIALIILYIKEKEICPAYISKSKLYELSKLYDYIMNHLKSLEVSGNHLNRFKYSIFCIFK